MTLDKLLGDAGRPPALSSTSNGLDIGFRRKRDAVASHYGFSLFDIEHTAYYVLQKLFRGAPNEHQVMGSESWMEETAVPTRPHRLKEAKAKLLARVRASGVWSLLHSPSFDALPYNYAKSNLRASIRVGVERAQRATNHMACLLHPPTTHYTTNNSVVCLSLMVMSRQVTPEEHKEDKNANAWGQLPPNPSGPMGPEPASRSNSAAQSIAAEGGAPCREHGAQ